MNEQHPVNERNSKRLICLTCFKRGLFHLGETTDLDSAGIKTLKSDGFVACEICDQPLVPAVWVEHILRYERSGYKELPFGTFDTTKELGASELCMHTHTVNRTPVRVWVNQYRYGLAVLDDGSILDGCFVQYGEGGGIGLS